jgi:hypothetical protein
VDGEHNAQRSAAVRWRTTQGVSGGLGAIAASVGHAPVLASNWARKLYFDATTRRRVDGVDD